MRFLNNVFMFRYPWKLLSIFLFLGEMMMSLLWYYRPEHVEGGRNSEDLPEELFASKHRLVTDIHTLSLRLADR